MKKNKGGGKRKKHKGRGEGGKGWFEKREKGREGIRNHEDSKRWKGMKEEVGDKERREKERMVR